MSGHDPDYVTYTDTDSSDPVSVQNAQIALNPTENSKINRASDGADVHLIFELEDYIDIQIAVSFNILVKECHVLSFDVAEISPIIYNIFQSAISFDAANYFTLEPACVYDISYSLAVSPDVEDKFYDQEDENSSIWFLSSRNTSLTNEYDFTVTVKLEDYPKDDPFDGTTGIKGIDTTGENPVSFKVELVDLCPNPELNSLVFDFDDSDVEINQTEEDFTLYAIIGSRN